MLKKISVLSSFLVASLIAQAQPTLVEKVEATPGKLTVPYEKWKLPNGLTVIISEDHSDPIVSVEVTYHVGSARESIGKSGFAHFFEHMMFEGSDHVKDKEHIRIVNETGGNMNGFTEKDKTVYFETMPANYLETALWLESDRMGFLLDSVTKQKFEIQRATVKNEKGENVENQPYALAFTEILNQTLYPVGHPYNWPTIGYVDDLNRVTVDDLKNFFLRWYGPNNATLTIVGDVNPKEALSMSEKYFGPIKSCPEVKKMKAMPPLLAADKYANYVDNIYLPLTLMVYPTVPLYHRDEAPLDLLSSIMGSGNNSIFYKNFVKSEVAAQAVVQHAVYELSGEFQIIVLSYPNNVTGDVAKDFDETEKKIHATLDEFEKTGTLREEKPYFESKGIQLYTSETHAVRLDQMVDEKGLAAELEDFAAENPFTFSEDPAVTIEIDSGGTSCQEIATVEDAVRLHVADHQESFARSSVESPLSSIVFRPEHVFF